MLIHVPPRPPAVHCPAVRCRYNRLYTVTAQCLEEDRPQYEATLQAIVRSLGLPAQRA